MKLFNSIKYSVGNFLQPIWPFFRDALVKSGIIHHYGRQPFLFGKLKNGLTKDDFLKFAESIGFHNHFIAWKDDKEIFSVRRLDQKDERFQFHVRLFQDGELRGHREYSPEISPYKHFYEIGFTNPSTELSAWFAPILESGSTTFQSAEAVSLISPS